MTIYYILADKERSKLPSGNLESSNYGEFDANSRRFTGIISAAPTFTLLNNKPANNSVRTDQVVLKVEVDDLAIRYAQMKKEPVIGGLAFTTRITDDARETLKIKVISQIMPDDTERFKHNAELEERPAAKPKKQNPIIRFATKVAQLGIDVKEKIENKKAPEPPKAGKHM
jgi:hypothetical protein